MGAIGTASWIFASNGPLIVAGRLIAGVVLFMAQGALLLQVSKRSGSSGGLLAVSAGLGLGSGVSGVAAADSVGSVLPAHERLTTSDPVPTTLRLTTSKALHVGCQGRCRNRSLTAAT